MAATAPHAIMKKHSTPDASHGVSAAFIQSINSRDDPTCLVTAHTRPLVSGPENMLRAEVAFRTLEKPQRTGGKHRAISSRHVRFQDQLKAFEDQYRQHAAMLTDVQEYLKARASLENEYSHGLNRLAQQVRRAMCTPANAPPICLVASLFWSRVGWLLCSACWLVVGDRNRLSGSHLATLAVLGRWHSICPVVAGAVKPRQIPTRTVCESGRIGVEIIALLSRGGVPGLTSPRLAP